MSLVCQSNQQTNKKWNSTVLSLVKSCNANTYSQIADVVQLGFDNIDKGERTKKKVKR